MTNNVKNLDILPALKPYINAIFLIESRKSNFDYDVAVVEPNGAVKLVIPLKNAVSGKCGDDVFVAKPNQISLVGLFDSPFKIECLEDQSARILVVEFHPSGAYRYLKSNQEQHVNNFCPFQDLYGRVIGRLEELLSNENEICKKVERLQHHLQNMIFNSEADLIFDFSINQITQSNGSITMKELERKTGYSSRWLNIKFKQKLGISPKSYASIVRFQALFKYMAVTRKTYQLDKFYLGYYHDQSHFIREFKRYSGTTPKEFCAAR